MDVWEVERWHNLYFELGASAQLRCRIENRAPAYDQPYMQIANLHPWLSRLPPAGCRPAETGFDPGAAFRALARAE